MIMKHMDAFNSCTKLFLTCSSDMILVFLWVYFLRSYMCCSQTSNSSLVFSREPSGSWKELNHQTTVFCWLCIQVCQSCKQPASLHMEAVKDKKGRKTFWSPQIWVKYLCDLDLCLFRKLYNWPISSKRWITTDSLWHRPDFSPKLKFKSNQMQRGVLEVWTSLSVK